MADFLEALDEVKPAFGAVIESLESYRLHGESGRPGGMGNVLQACRVSVCSAWKRA